MVLVDDVESERGIDVEELTVMTNTNGQFRDKDVPPPGLNTISKMVAIGWHVDHVAPCPQTALHDPQFFVMMILTRPTPP